jgi:hypothetical protein
MAQVVYRSPVAALGGRAYDFHSTRTILCIIQEELQRVLVRSIAREVSEASLVRRITRGIFEP